jgi:opacity protein-like surface antigen
MMRAIFRIIFLLLLEARPLSALATPSDIDRFISGHWVGTEIPFHKTWQMQLGFSYYAPDAVYLDKDTIVPHAHAANINPFDYTHRIHSQQFLVEGKLQNAAHTKIQPYLAFGLGAARNKSYPATTLMPAFLAATEFPQNTTTSMSYMFGAGIDADLDKHWRIGIGYRFSDYGQVSIEDSITAQKPAYESFPKTPFHMQTVLVQLTYLIT